MTENKGENRRDYRGMLIAMLKQRDGNKCKLCGGTLKLETTQIDHKIPLSLGGGECDPFNLQIVHKGCNQEKGQKLPDPKDKIFILPTAIEKEGYEAPAIKWEIKNVVVEQAIEDMQLQINN